MSDTVVLIVIAALLIPVAGSFAAADAALTTVSRARVDALVRAGRGGSRALAAVVADRPRYVNLLLLLRLAAETAATVLLTVALASRFAPPWLGALLAGGIMLVVSYVLIGVGPRTLGRQHPYGIGLVAAVPVRALARLLSPLARLLILIGNAITPGRGFREGPFSSEVELRELVDMASSRGVVDEDERQMIHSVFELGDTLVREVMVPRPDVVWTERCTTVDRALKLALKSGYSRLPVLGDTIDDIVGVAYLKDLVTAQAAADAGEVQVAAVMRPAVFVPDSKQIAELLREMQTGRNHMAIVVDEYGGTAGVVTIEDILEEIVGEITDEYDSEEVPAVQPVDDETLRLAARLPVEDLGELFGPALAGTRHAEELLEVMNTTDVDTVGGLLAQRLGRVPLPGAEAQVAGLRLLAEGGKDARGRMRITSVLVTPLRSDENGTQRGDGDGAEAGADRREETDVRHG